MSKRKRRQVEAGGRYRKTRGTKPRKSRKKEGEEFFVAFRDKGKEKVVEVEEEEEEEIVDIVLADVAGPSVPIKKRKKRAVRKPTIKRRLLAKLRADKKRKEAEVRQLKRDINSLVCHRKK